MAIISAFSLLRYSTENTKWSRKLVFVGYGQYWAEMVHGIRCQIVLQQICFVNSVFYLSHLLI